MAGERRENPRRRRTLVDTAIRAVRSRRGASRPAREPVTSAGRRAAPRDDPQPVFTDRDGSVHVLL